MDKYILPPGPEVVSAEAVRVGGALPAPYTRPGQFELATPTISAADYWRILLKRKWTVFCTAMVIVITTALVTLRMTPIYEASGRISVGRPSSEFLQFKDSPAAEDDYTVAMETQVRILQSDSLALSVIKKLGLDKKPAGKNASVVEASQTDSTAETAMIARFKSGLRVITVPNTRVLEIRYSNPDRQLAARVVNTLVNTYIEQNIKNKFDSTMQAADWLSRQLADLQIAVETSQEKLVRYQREHEIVGGDEKTNIVTSKLSDLNKELSTAQADRIQKQSFYLYAAGGSDKAFADDRGALINKLREQETELKNQIAQMSVQFGPSYPRVLELKARLDQTEQDMQAESLKNVNRLKSDYLAAAQREKLLREAFDKQKQEANQLNQSAIEYNLLKREADANRQLYDGLLQKLKEAGISAALTSSNVQVVDAARVPLAPSQPNIPRNLELGLLFGLASGIALAFTLEAMDTTISMPEQVETYAGLVSIGMIPISSTIRSTATAKMLKARAEKNQPGTTQINLIPHVRPKSEVAESYRALRTSILLSSPSAPPKIILFTSPLPQEGKTTTSVNTAVALSQQGRRVLLVDADLRRPSVDKIFGLPPRAGLSEILTGGCTPEQAILQQPELPNLYVLPAGRIPPHPSELLSSPAMKQLIDRWRGEYDHVVFDSPPSLTVTDAVMLSVNADRVIMIVRAGKTTKTALRRCRDLLLHVNARIMGVVINGIDLRSPDHYYYYYSGTKAHGGYYLE